jgi:diacylglycerol O-acyltransferase / wax synthase
MPAMPITDAAFLLVEARERPTHVGGLQVFDLPPGADGEFLREMYRQAVEVEEVHPFYRRRPHRSLATLGQWEWIDDDQLDLEYHVRHSALPHPGRVRELLALISRLHGTLLDRNRPLWEGHLIEGLEDNRFAVYTKMHHAMVDGVSALRILQESLSEDPAETGMLMPWARPARQRRHRPDPGRVSPLNAVLGVGTGAVRLARGTAGVGVAAAGAALAALREEAAAMPFQAPKTIFNTTITGARRFAADSWPLDRIRAVGKAGGATVNDTVLAMCSGALRSYLLEQGELPDKPLVAMVPVSLRGSEGSGDAGNAVGSILCNLATDLADPADRLERIVSSMNQAKQRLAGLSPNQVVALSALWMSGLLVGPLLRVGWPGPPPFNLVISNVPGPRQPLYFNGARLQGLYPLSIPMDGQAFNITVTSYAADMGFGLTGCRRNVPHLQRILVHLDSALTELEKAVT